MFGHSHEMADQAARERRMTPMQKVKERYPEAMLTPESAGMYDVITPARKPSPGYFAHRALGAGKTPQAAWSDAAQRILKRGRKAPQSDGG